MNERIRDLEKQSGIDIYGLGLDRANWESKLEKFAELIVRECAKLTLDYKNSEHYRGWLDYRNEIRKHFGVEE